MASQQKTLVKAQPRAIAQVFFTLFQVGTAFASFYFAMRVKHYTDLLNDNFEDQPTTQFLPCIRNTIHSQCDPAYEPNCWDRCCPSGYSCARWRIIQFLQIHTNIFNNFNDKVFNFCLSLNSFADDNYFVSNLKNIVVWLGSPIFGLHCFDLSNPCGDPEWCEFYADISGQCRNDVCQLDKMVERMVVWAFILSGIGVLFDIIDMVMFFAAQGTFFLHIFVSISMLFLRFRCCFERNLRSQVRMTIFDFVPNSIF